MNMHRAPVIYVTPFRLEVRRIGEFLPVPSLKIPREIPSLMDFFAGITNSTSKTPSFRYIQILCLHDPSYHHFINLSHPNSKNSFSPHLSSEVAALVGPFLARQHFAPNANLVVEREEILRENEQQEKKQKMVVPPNKLQNFVRRFLRKVETNSNLGSTL